MPWLFAIPVFAWIAAGAVNSGVFIMGDPPDRSNLAATLVAVCAWIVAGWLTGAWGSRGFIRFAVVFWVAAVAGAPLTFWALNASTGMSASQGGFVLPLLLFVLVAPLYGLYALLPAWEPIVQAAAVGLTAFAMTVIAYATGWRTHQAPGGEAPNGPTA